MAGVSAQEGEVTGADGGLAWAVHELAVGVAGLDAVIARRLGLNHTDYLALKHLLAAEPALTPAQLARRLGLATGSTTTVVDRLEGSGHLQRRRHPRDRRKVELVPTAHAVASVEAALAPVAASITDLERGLSADEARVVRQVLHELTGIHDAHGTTAL